MDKFRTFWMPFLFCMALSTTGVARDGDGAGNGGGTAEKLFLRAHEQLPGFVDDCLRAPGCVSTAEGLEILHRVQQGLKTLPPSPDRIVFRNSDEFPFHGYKNHAPRSARTGDTLGGKIYVNRDHLYRSQQGGKVVPITLQEAVAWLVDEYAHQTGFSKDQEHSILDRLCFEVERFLSRRIVRLYEIDGLFGGPNYGGIFVTNYSANFSSGHSDLLVTNPTVLDESLSNRTFSLRDQIVQALRCPEDLFEANSTWSVNGFTINNLHWASLGKVRRDSTELWLEGHVTYECQHHSKEGQAGFVTVGMGTLEIALRVSLEESKVGRIRAVAATSISFGPLFRGVPEWDEASKENSQ